MTLLAPIVKWFYQVTGSFFAAMLITIGIFLLIALPFYLLSIKHKRKKRAIAPEVRAIRDKYHATAMGVDDTKDESLSEEIRAMSKDERGAAMAKELNELYKQRKYHAYTGWIPGIVYLILIIVLYMSISGAIPVGSVYGSIPWDLFKNGQATFPSLPIIMFIAVPLSQLLCDLYSALRNKKKKVVEEKMKELGEIAPGTSEEDKAVVEQKSKKIAGVVAAVLPIALGLALSIYIGIRVTTAIAITIVILQVIRFVATELLKLFVKGKDKSAEKNAD